MCVAAYIPAGATIAENILRGVYKRNDDGIGLAWSDGSKLEIWRTMSDIDRIVKMIDEMRDLPRLVHFRYATHGTVTLDNVHPFWLDSRRRAVIAHNGVITIPQKSNESDTRSFVDNVLSQLKDGWWNNTTTVAQIEKLVNGSRIVIMEDDGRAHYLNKHSGETTADGVWFSNSQWKEFLDPTVKSRAAASINASDGSAKVYTQPSHYGNGRGGYDSWNDTNRGRDPFHSQPTKAPSPVAQTKAQTDLPLQTTTTTAGGTDTKKAKALPPCCQTPEPSSNSQTSTTGSSVSTPAVVTSSGHTTSGPIKQSDLAAWTIAFGRKAIIELALGYVSMPDGAYGSMVIHCADCAPDDVADGTDDLSSGISAVCLTDPIFASEQCEKCHTFLHQYARDTFAAFAEDADDTSAVSSEGEVDWIDEDKIQPAHTEQADGSPSTEENKETVVSGAADGYIGNNAPYSD